MNSIEIAVAKLEKMIRASRLNDIDLLMKTGQAQRLAEIEAAITRLDPGAYLVGCGPYTQGIYRLSGPRVVFGREGTVHEAPVGEALDFAIADGVTFRPREVSRRHFEITCEMAEGETHYLIRDLHSTCGTFVNGDQLESPESDDPETIASAVPLADLDVISMGPNAINVFLFLVIPHQSDVSSSG